MVALILTRAGFDDMRPRINLARDALWVGAGVLSVAEVAELRRSGMNLTEFTYLLEARDVESAICTIAEHHPKEILWVETICDGWEGRS